MSDARVFKIADTAIRRGETRDVRLRVSETYTGDPVTVPIRVIRGKKRGPRLFVTAAIHGDEINGCGVVHTLLFDEALDIKAGTLVLAPVLNIFGFENQTRYLPDGRDLNRSFPGSTTGSLARRVANVIFREIVSQCDYGIDLHSASASRTNFPNVRGDLTLASVRRLASAFGAELMVNGKGPEGSMRREACNAGCPTIILEAGEIRKIEPSVLQIGVRGVRNVAMSLGMMDGQPTQPTYQARIDKTIWVRAEVGGILQFHVRPGEVIEAGQPISTNINVFGRERNVVVSPVDGIVLGMTTIPTVKPGEPVCHVAAPRRSIRGIRSAIKAASPGSLHSLARHDLATNISITEPSGDELLGDDAFD